MNAFLWCIVICQAMIIALVFVREPNARLVIGALAAVVLLIGVLIGTGVIATTG